MHGVVAQVFLLAVARACLRCVACEGPSRQLPGRRGSLLCCGVRAAPLLPPSSLYVVGPVSHMLIAAALLAAAILSRRCSVRPAVWRGLWREAGGCARLMWCVCHACGHRTFSVCTAAVLDRSLSAVVHKVYLNGPPEWGRGRAPINTTQALAWQQHCVTQSLGRREEGVERGAQGRVGGEHCVEEVGRNCN